VKRSPGERTLARRAPARTARDQKETGFTSILCDLVARVPGARAAALVDVEGETVDYAGALRPFDVRLAAAHWRIVLGVAAAQRSLRGLRFVTVRASRGGYLVRALPDGYALVVVLARAAGFARWERAVAGAAWALSVEAGWEHGGNLPAWFPVHVACDRRRRPLSVRVGGLERPLEILGAVSPRELARGERGWRVRLGMPADDGGATFSAGANAVDARGIANAVDARGIANAIEATLIREAGGVWYADQLLDL
jgi:predicted regulator of Ras-like GTPase activity (Roadblock/LC7/MglB family)